MNHFGKSCKKSQRNRINNKKDKEENISRSTSRKRKLVKEVAAWEDSSSEEESVKYAAEVRKVVDNTKNGGSLEAKLLQKSLCCGQNKTRMVVFTLPFPVSLGVFTSIEQNFLVVEMNQQDFHNMQTAADELINVSNLNISKLVAIKSESKDPIVVLTK
ncbi:hypothetical protein QE152_g5190 [Popillia japonica]|uniref:Uncharacterized protein n=1 Tax=Popillia japonica TaxID=7064 RepID=A0AAW1N0D4_POPJA